MLWQAAYEPGKGVGDMSEVLAMLLDWATKEGRDLRVLTFDFNKFFDRYISGWGTCMRMGRWCRGWSMTYRVGGCVRYHGDMLG